MCVNDNSQLGASHMNVMKSQSKLFRFFVSVALHIQGVAENTKYSIIYVIVVICYMMFHSIGFVIGIQACNGAVEKIEVLSLFIPQISLFLAFLCMFNTKKLLVRLLKRIKSNKYGDYVISQTDITITTKVIQWTILMMAGPIFVLMLSIIYVLLPHVPISDRNSLLMPHWFSCGSEDSKKEGFLTSLCYRVKTKSELMVLNTILFLACSTFVVYFAAVYFLYILLVVELMKLMEIFKIKLGKLITNMNSCSKIKIKNKDWYRNKKKIDQWNIVVREEFVDIVKYQQYLKSCLHEIVDILKDCNAVSVSNSFISTALLLFIMLSEGKNSSLTALKALCICGLSVASVIFICVCGHVTATMNEILFDELCNIPWYWEDKEFRKVYLTALTLNRRSVYMKVFDIYEINLRTIISLIRTVYSVLNMFHVTNS